MRDEDSLELKTWLKRKHDRCSPEIQNEMLQLLANELVRRSVTAIHARNPVMYSVICDGTRDVSGKEQICICLRYVDEKLSPVEFFVGVYEAGSTTGEAVSNIVFDVLIRPQLSVSHLRGQAYDGASHMSGHKRGVQALVKVQLPLAPFINCAAHTANVVLQDSCGASYVIKNSLQLAHDIDDLFTERSFSSLRRLKTYLRSTMTQTRLNYVVLLSAYQKDLDLLDLNTIEYQFINRSDRRCHTFGKR
ncbi:hypothetical protein PR048_032189 [Dryococelus australis]|uniref:DUF4371 domain-containing protein n=1 Tax=Dryococelus australis TaxID=614101 RepID=A0ABQ9G1I0_9NEOP|nr:hypothetical protein PR048_032189 [Dryococelus australis]